MLRSIIHTALFAGGVLASFVSVVAGTHSLVLFGRPWTVFGAVAQCVADGLGVVEGAFVFDSINCTFVVSPLVVSTLMILGITILFVTMNSGGVLRDGVIGGKIDSLH